MKKMKKALALIMVLAIFLSLSVTSAFAASAQKDGVSITLATDKREYKKDEDVKISLKLKNTNSFAVTDVSAKLILPDGLEFKSQDTQKRADVLKSGEELVLALNAKAPALSADTTAPVKNSAEKDSGAEKDKAPDTGHSSKAIIAVISAIAVFGVIAFIAFKLKGGKKIVSIALSLTLAMSAFALLSSPAFAQEKNTDSEIEEVFTIDGEEKTVKAEIAFNKATLSTLKLTASENQIAANEKDKTEVLFFAESNSKLHDVKLTNGDKVVAAMLDNGKDGDQKANDRIYTAKVMIDSTAVKDINFCAQGLNRFNEKVVSDTAKISVYEKLSDKELKSMENTDDEIEKLVDSEDFAKLDLDEKKEKAENLIAEQTKVGNIEKDSVSYDAKNEMYTFKYDCGILGGIMLKDFEQNDKLEGMQKNITVSPKMNFDASKNADSSSLNAIHSNAAIYYAFDFYFFSPRAQYYENIKKNWPNVGVNPKLDTRVTVNDLKSIDNYDIIVFSTHGTYINSNSFTGSVICLRDRGGFFKDLYYSADLKAQRIIKINRQYWVCPSFFEYYYADGMKLQDKIVFSESCTFMGEYGKVDTSYADTFIKCGVPTVVGFHNSVYAVYSVDLMNIYVTELAKGKSTQSALSIGMDQLGINDYEWAVEHGIQDARPENFAYPIICGSPLARLKAFS